MREIYGYSDVDINEKLPFESMSKSICVKNKQM